MGRDILLELETRLLTCRRIEKECDLTASFAILLENHTADTADTCHIGGRVLPHLVPSEGSTMGEADRECSVYVEDGALKPERDGLSFGIRQVLVFPC